MRTFLTILVLLIGLNLNAQSNWTSVGPISGDNYYSICTTPDSTYYVAAFSPGKILKSTNGGNTWTIAYSNPNILLKSVYFTTNQIGYAGGLSANTGRAIILKTFNGGTSWTAMSLPNSWKVDNGSINDIVFYNDSNGFAVGHQGLYLKTTNAGASWQGMNFPNYSHIWDIGHYNQDTLYYASADGLYLDYPTNRNTRIISSSFSCVDRGNNDVFGISDSNIHALYSGGISTTQLATNPLPSRSIQSILAISDSTILIAGHDRNIYISHDGGNTFSSDITPINNYRITNLKYLNGIVWAVGSFGQILKRQTIVGVKEVKKQDEVTFYPNPVNDKLYIESNTQPKEVLIFQSNGQLVNNFILNENTLNVTNLNKGIYFIKIRIDDIWHSSKFIKQ